MSSDDDSMNQAKQDTLVDEDETVKISPSQSEKSSQTKAESDSVTLKLPSSAPRDNNPILSMMSNNPFPINLAIWLSIIASLLIIFSFLSGITSLEEGLGYISGAATPPVVLGGSPSNWLPGPTDIPEAMIQADSFTYSNEDIAKDFDDPVGVFTNLVQWGRGLNFQQKYLHKDGCSSKTGLREISLQAVRHETASGAKQYLDWISLHARDRFNARQVDTLDLVGEHAFIYWLNDTSNCIPQDDLLYVRIEFQRYNALGLIAVGAVNGTMSRDDMQSLAMRLARVMDLRFVAEANQ